MKDKIKQFSKTKGIYCITIALSLIIILSAYIAEGIMPFGRFSLTIVDSPHQYVPFFAELRNKLINHESFSYTWNVALGSNFSSLYAYYISSPLNLIVVLFPLKAMPLVIDILIAVKLVFSAWAMCFYLCNRKDGEKRLLVVPFALAYAFSSYMVGYCWNVMWLDALMVFPLIMLGFEKMMEDKKFLLYVLALFYALWGNYYIGYMICVFLVLWFFVYPHRNLKEFIGNGIRFAYFSLIAGGLSMISLLPAYFGVMDTASGGAKLPKHSWYGNIFNLLQEALFDVDPFTNDNFDGNVNLYAGIFVLIGIALYFTTTKTKLVNKVKYAVLLAFLAVSFNEELLNFMWHGMHNQFGIPNRFSFLFIFVAILMTYEVFTRIKEIHYIEIITAFVFCICFLLACRNYSKEKLMKYQIAMSVLLFVIYSIIAVLGSEKLQILKKQSFSLVFAVFASTEIIVASIVSFTNVGHNDIQAKYFNVENNVAAVKELDSIAKEDGATFYRSELMHSNALDEVTYYGMKGVGTFCSTVKGDTSVLMGRLGFYSAVNEFLYLGNCPITNSILDIKYLVKRDKDVDNYDFDYVKEVNGVELYKNPYPLSIGYGVTPAIKEWEYGSNPSYNNINSLLTALSGNEERALTGVYPSFDAGSECGDVVANGNPMVFTPNISGEGKFSVSFEIPEDGQYQIEARGNSIRNIGIYVNDIFVGHARYMVQIFNLGELNKGDRVKINYEYRDCVQGESINAQLYIAKCDMDVYKKHYERLKRDLWNITDYSEGYLEGKINCTEDEVLFTTIPYDKGWKVTVDGESVDTLKLGEGFLGIDITKGEHIVEMKFEMPGKKIGILLSFISLFLLIVSILYSKIRLIVASRKGANITDEE